MHGQQQDVIVFTQSQQFDSKQRPIHQIERFPSLGVCESSSFVQACSVISQPTQINHTQVERLLQRDNLHGFSIDHRERRAQHFMATQSFIQALFERDRIERALQPH